MEKTFVILFCCLASFLGCGENKNLTVRYDADTDTNIINPERGWYFSFDPPCCDDPPNDINPPHEPLRARSEISWPGEALPPSENRPRSAKIGQVISEQALSVQVLQEMRNWEEKISLYRDIVKIEQYSGDIPQARLDQIQADLDAARTAGVKSIFRIIYNYGMKKGEAPANVISRHLDQLKPVIQKNADVIYAVQAGLLGGSGEACCESWLIDEDNNNGWSALSPEAIALYRKLLAIVPADRFVTLRYPRYKYQIAGWSNSDQVAITKFPINAKPISLDNAFDGSTESRLGYYNDNFAGDVDHWGFFNAWEAKDRNFAEVDSRYALMEGELSLSSDFNNENGVNEMKKYHFSAFHCCGNNSDTYEGWDGTGVAWKNSGQMDVMSRSLGYRFRLVTASIPQNLSSNSTFRMNLVMANDGWARIVNPRKVEIVFVNKATGAKFVLDVDGDGKGNRLWLPGPGETKSLSIFRSLPDGVQGGAYGLFLHLADPYPSIHDRPEYSIRLANRNLWQAGTGYNSLMASVEISENIFPW